MNASGRFAGGFNYVEGGGTHRVFAFQTADGHISAVTLHPSQRGFIVATRQEARVLPAVNYVGKLFELAIGNDGRTSSVWDSSFTVTAVDATATPPNLTRKWTSVVELGGANPQEGIADTLLLNKPRTGWYYRAQVPDLDLNVPGLIILTLPGTGMHLHTFVGFANFGFSIDRR